MFVIFYGDAASGGQISIINNIFNNTFIYDFEALFFMSSTNFISPRSAGYNEFHNSLLLTNRGELIYRTTSSPSVFFNYLYNTTATSKLAGDIWTAERSGDGLVCDIATGCIVGFNPVIDANDDNIGDTDPSRRLSIAYEFDGLNILAIQNIEGGSGFVTNDYDVIIPINHETIGSPNTLISVNPNVLEFGYTDVSAVQFPARIYTFNNPLGVFLQSGSSINCGILSSDFCQMTDNGVFSPSLKYRGFIQVASNTEIEGINFYKTGINTGHIISNNADTIYNNIQIHDNVFVKDRVGGISYVETASNEMIKLRGNNINIYENIFTYSETITGSASVFLYVSATNDASNNVFNNTFQNSAINQSNEIFGIKCNTRFYNNYLESGINLSNNCVGLDATPLVWFPYTDGKIYGYWLGNYYEDNVGCIDADGDDFCDASYQSGTITDFYPLAIYPFDFTAQLLTADYVINNTLIDITLTRVSNNQTFEIPNTNGVIELGFIQESQFPDLICDFILDGVPVPNQTIIGGVSGQEYFIELTLWSERSYSYKVECYNDFNAENSGDIIFNVEFEDTETPNGNGNGEDGVIGEDIIGEDGVGNIGDIFNAENLGESGDAISDLFNLASQPLGWLILLGFVLLAFSFLGLIFGLVLWLVR